jgi:hypothetical protein
MKKRIATILAVFMLIFFVSNISYAVDDGIKLKAQWQIAKFHDTTGEIAEALWAGAPLHLFNPYSIEIFEYNLGLNEGLQELIDIICGIGTPIKWDATNAYLGVGDSTTAAQATDTGLLGTNKLYKAMDATYPQKVNQTVEWRSTYGSTDANFAWNEYTVSNTSLDTGKNLNRKVESKGIKVSGETWTLSLKITFQ